MFYELKNKRNNHHSLMMNVKKSSLLRRKLEIKCLKEQPAEHWRNRGHPEMKQTICIIGKSIV
jgi:hypothetical protein